MAQASVVPRIESRASKRMVVAHEPANAAKSSKWRGVWNAGAFFR